MNLVMAAALLAASISYLLGFFIALIVGETESLFLAMLAYVGFFAVALVGGALISLALT